MKSQYTNLFAENEASDKHLPYATFELELEAIRTGRKGMSIYTSSADDEDGRALILDAAAKAGLLCVLRKEKVQYANSSKGMLTYYVLSQRELWRIPAYEVADEALKAFGSSDALEHVLSSLLGYTEAEILDWIKQNRFSQVGWEGATVILLLSQSHYLKLRALGYKCLDSLRPPSETIAIFDRNRRILKKDAQRLYPNFAICRAALNGKFFRSKFPITDRKFDGQEVFEYQIAAEQLEEFNLNLISRIEIYRNGVWEFDGVSRNRLAERSSKLNI